MSNDPSSDPQRPYQPPQPYEPPPSAAPQAPTPEPPRPPTYQPGYAALPQPGAEPAGPYPPTTQFPAQPGYAPPGYPPPRDYPAGPDYTAGPQYAGTPGYAGPPPDGYGQPGYGQPPRPPRKSNVPLIAVIVAVAVLLCGGAVTAGVLVVNNVRDRAKDVADRAKEATKPLTDPTLPTEVPEIPGLPTDLPTLPTDLPNLPDGTGKKITVVYEVTGDGPAEIVYTEKLGDSPKRVSNAKLPWKVTRTMQGTSFVSVTAIRSETGSGSISCRATVDGKEVAQRTREGEFATVSCIKFVFE